MSTKVHKIEILVVDIDDVGAEEIKSVIKDQKYPNYCISPRVMMIQTVETEWSDDHPLNKWATMAQAYRDLFSDCKEMRILGAEF